MVYNSLKTLLEQYPYFLDKRPSSNFYKTREIWNNRIMELYNDLFQVYLDSKIRKHILIWKTQTQPYIYTINFAVSIPLLKKVTCYKNNTEIYSKEYAYEDEAYDFYYTYDDSTPEVTNDDGSEFDRDYDPATDDPEHIANVPETRLIIPDDKYSLKIETYSEYTLYKGFPENDSSVGDIYDHDQSLDEWGVLFDIPRKKYFYSDDTDYSLTEPSYNNRETEDDYHYMNRILYLAEHLNDTPLPLLELWKLFGDDIDAVMTNRDALLCRMFSKEKHTPAGGKYDDNWTPEAWEHKDKMGCPREDPIYFFASVNDASPIYGRDLIFTFKFYNSLVEPNTDYKYIRVYLNGEEYILDKPLTDYSWIISTKSFGEEVYDLKFQFRAYRTLEDYNENVEYIESEEIPVIVKGCGNADYYVNYNTGSDKNEGTRDKPFKTLEYAVSKVETSNNVIVLQQGTHIINNVIQITTDTSIISCNNAIIKSLYSCDIFYVHHDHSLDLINVGLKYKCCEMFAEDEVFTNNNIINEKYRVTIPLSVCRIPVAISSNNNRPTIYAHTNYTITGDVTTLELTGNKTYVESDNTGKSFDLRPASRVIKHLNIMGEKVNNETVDLYTGIVVDESKKVATIKTNNNGEYNFNLRLNKSGTFNYLVNHPESEKHCNKEYNILFTIKDMPTVLTGSLGASEILIGDLLPITYTLKDYYNVNVETGSLYLYEDDVLVETVDAYDDFTYIPPLGQHTYKIVFKGDSYVESVVDGLTCNVRKYHTSMVLLSSKASYTIDDDVIIYGTLIDELQRPVSNALIKLYDGDVLLSQSYCEEDGNITFNIGKLSEGKHYLQLRYEGSPIYDECNSNSFRIRIRTDSVADINLYLYPDYKILNTDTRSIPVHVYACDKNGNPLKTTFKMWSTYDAEYDTVYTTENNGWCDLTLTTNAIHYCHGLVIQAISNIDEDVYSNIVFIRDFVEQPLEITDYNLISEKSSYSYKNETINVNGFLIDEEESAVPNEDVKLLLYDGETLLDSKIITTNVKGEFNCGLNNNGIRLDTLTVKLEHIGNNNYTGITDSVDIVFYPPKTNISTYDSLTLYKDINTFNVPVEVIDEFNNPNIDGTLKLTFNGEEFTGSVVDGYYIFNDLTVPAAGNYDIVISYDGNSYYQNKEVSFNLKVLKLDTSISDVNVPIITYSDPFTITGVLNNTTRNTKIGNVPVSLYVDNTLIKSENTNNDGVFNISHTIMDDSGSHSLYLKFDETSVYNAAQSSVYNIDVNKETTVLNLINPKTTLYVGGDFTLNGELLSDDGEVIQEPVKLYVDNSLKETVTPGDDGAFSFNYLNNLGLGTYNIRVLHSASTNYTESEYSYTCTVKEDVLELFMYIDSMDETGTVNYGEEFIVTVIDSEFTENTKHASIFSNLEFNIYNSDGDLVEDVVYEDNIYLDSRVFTMQYGAIDNFLLPGEYTLEVISPATGDYDYKQVTLPLTIKDNLKLYSYITGENYTDTVNVGDEFIVTVIDDLFNEGVYIYEDVYQNLELTIYDPDNNIINIPYELNTYKDLAEYTFLYGATNDLTAGTYKIVIVSPATPEHGRRQTTINIKITE